MNSMHKVGNHTLRTIYYRHHCDDTTDVVRWCEECGAVVVDEDYGGRTNSGGVMKMMFPKIGRE